MDDEKYKCLQIEHGKIKGQKFKDWKNRDYFGFLSIPYAKPPTGGLRFEAPEDVDPWQGILDVTKDLPMPMQKNPIKHEIIGTEDCLYLNVFTPTMKNNANLSVMVFIHGGGFSEGCGKMRVYGPDYLIAEDIVIVSINYRLGFFGSICTQDQSILAGNCGLKDQVMALKWVKKNIAFFGGNENDVTIMGQSAGAASVHLHMLSPLSKGLFHKVIIQSTTALNFWAKGEFDSAKYFCEKKGLPIDDVKDMVRRLRELPAEEITAEQYEGLVIRPTTKPYVSPIVEHHKNEPNFLPKYPLSIIKSADYTKVPMLIGYNSNEGLMFDILRDFYMQDVWAMDVRDFTKCIPKDLLSELNPNLETKVAERIKSFYFGDKPVDHSCAEADAIRREMNSDAYFRLGIHQAIEEHVRTSNSSVYFYEFDMDTGLNAFKIAHPVHKNVPGGSHSDELGYLFKMPKLQLEAGSVEELCMKRMVKMWTSFIKTGNPIRDSDDTLIVKWEAVTKEKLNCMKIRNNTFEVVEYPHKDSIDFWKDLYDLYSKRSKM